MTDKNKKSGYNKPAEGLLGGKYTQSFDKDGRKTGTSQTEEDWLGQDRTVHRDQDGRKTGTSEPPRVCRRLIYVSYAARGRLSRLA
jgi:hypothetical protein